MEEWACLFFFLIQLLVFLQMSGFVWLENCFLNQQKISEHHFTSVQWQKRFKFGDCFWHGNPWLQYIVCSLPCWAERVFVVSKNKQATNKSIVCNTVCCVEKCSILHRTKMTTNPLHYSTLNGMQCCKNDVG